MTIFDLLFIVAVLALVISLLIAAFHALRGRGARAVAVVRRIVVAGAAYFAVIAAVSLATPQDVVAKGTPQCFDDWCITVVQADHIHVGAGDSLPVTLRLSSRARGITQGERDVRVAVVDDERHVYWPVANDGVALSVQLPPGGTATAARDFLLPAGAKHPALIVVHDRFPHCCIIGDRESLLHRPAVVPLD